MNVINQKPAVLTPVYHCPFTGDMDPIAYMKETITQPIFTPMVPGTNVSITTGNTAVTDDDIVNHIIACCGDLFDQASETWCKELFQNTLVYFNSNTTQLVSSLFAIQSGIKEKLPMPSNQCVYTPATDIIPTCSEFLSGLASEDKLFATFAFYAKPETLGFYFVNEAAFDAFKAWMQNQLSLVANNMPTDTMNMMNDFQTQIHLNELTESLILRNDDGDNIQEKCFARTLLSYLMEYTKNISSSQFGVMPFDLGELYIPKTIVFVNIEKHARSSAVDVTNEWKLINQTLSNPPAIVSNKKIQSLTSVAKQLKKIAAGATYAARNKTMLGRMRVVRFRKTPPRKTDILKYIKRAMAKMHRVNRSMNTYKMTTLSYQRPNRRDPDDFNKMGKSTSTRYNPDIHIYADTSGSISQEDYEGTVKACIQIAKRLNINLYFNSFSHVLSQCTCLPTKNKSAKEIYRTFEKIPKVTGGTNYHNVWDYIMQSKKRQRELSIIITDFEYVPPRTAVHPQNLYYIPCATTDWNDILSEATSFCKNMTHIDPDIRKKMMF